ncbi:tetratricopeptide repeat protein [Pseudogulbenkiania sp. MAI-1]|uniref:tetratricopeptide repeat protein n=1 Tax=Pseudogulbenkiania sp. MAI-1 TaxID=990370 RepID=UPI001E4DB706|nr:tetratricopeptide repeat protein [Pseudogulbenkiania sp. MAI-1]
MKPLNRTLPLLLALLLSACAAPRQPERTTAPAEPAVAADSASDDDGDEAGAAKAEASNARLPKVELDSHILFGVLAGEIAAQRGAAGASAVTYLDLARQTRDPRLAQRAAEFALFSGQLKVASEALALWVELDPDSGTAREQLLITLLRSGKLAESRPLVEELLQREPARAGAIFVQLARLTALQGDKKGAYDLIQQLAERYPELPEARFSVLAVAADLGNQEVVDQEFDRLARIAPKWDLPVAWQTDRLRRTDLNAAIAFLKKELERRPEAGLELKMAYPRLLVGAKRFDEARRAFEVLLQAQPKNAELMYGAGLLALQQRDLPVAKRHLEAALAEKHPESDFIRYTLGQLAEEQDDLPAARRWYESVGQGAQYLPAQGRLAELDAAAGNPDAGIARLQKLDIAGNARVQVVLAQSQIARDAKRYDLAHALLSQALQEAPGTPELLYERALVADLLGNYEGTESDLRAYLREKPDDPQGLNALGYTLANRTTRYQEALGLIEKALRAEPDNPMVLDSMGWVLFKLGRLEPAREHLQRAFTASPDAEIAAHYGEVLWQLNRRDEAREVWKKATGSEASLEMLKDTVHRLERP